MWGKKLEAWKVPCEVTITTDKHREAIHVYDVVIGIAIGVLATMLCVWLF